MNMNASMVRLGGILAFVVIAVGIIGGWIAGGSGVAVIILNLIITALLLFVFWSTKGLFNAHSYRRADVPIIGIMALFVVMWLFGLVGGAGMGAIASPQSMGQAMGIIGIISLLVMLVAFVLWMMFGVQSMGYGGAGGGGLWKAIGILYLVGDGLIILFIVLMILGAIASSAALVGIGGIFGIIGALVLIAAWICHGIGLIIGAGKMAQT